MQDCIALLVCESGFHGFSNICACVHLKRVKPTFNQTTSPRSNLQAMVLNLQWCVGLFKFKSYTIELLNFGMKLVVLKFV